MSIAQPNHAPSENPFSTRYVRPGALRYVFPGDQSLCSLLKALRNEGFWGQILGPHGSGKSTLLVELAGELSREGRTAVRFELHDGESKLKLPRRRWKRWNCGTQVLVDGYEQLSFWSRRKLKRICQLQGAGLLITTHADAGLPLLHKTEIPRQLARQLVNQLLGDEAGHLDSDCVETCFQRHGDNLREAFFELYDLYESQAPALREVARRQG